MLAKDVVMLRRTLLHVKLLIATEKSLFKDIIHIGGWVVKAFSKIFLMNLFLTLGGGKSLFDNADLTYFDEFQ